jgi:translin
MAEFEGIFTDIRSKMERDNEIREELILLGRRSIRNSSLSIRHLHRKEMDKAQEIIKENSKLITKINSLAKNMSTLPFGMILSCNQEYAESVLLYSFLREESFPSYTDLNIPYLAYLHGIPDFIGELRRVILDSLRKKDGIDISIRALELMEDLYSLLITLDYPDGLTYNLRKKTDYSRNITEKTRGDVTLAMNRIDLIESFNEILREHSLLGSK